MRKLSRKISIIIFILQLRKMRFREVKNLPNRTANKWQNRNFDSELLEANILLINHYIIALFPKAPLL